MKKLIILLSLLILSPSLYANSFNTKQWQTGNGTRVVFYQAMEVPMLYISTAFAAGSAYDGPQYGLSALTTRLLDQGDAGLDATLIAEKLADTGARYSGESNRDMVALSLQTLVTDDALKQAVEAYEMIISKPDFLEEAFNREKNQLLMTIEQAQESPSDVANLAFFKELYQAHPYAHPINGTKETVKGLQIKDVQNFYKKYFVSNNAVLVLVGAIDESKAHQLAEQITQNLPKGVPAAAVPQATPLTARAKISIEFPSSQTMLRLGQVGINHHNPDYFPLITGNYILGGGALVSRLAIEVREKRGLTYGVTSQFMPMPGDGPFLISLSTQNQEAASALQITQETLASFVTNGPTEAELVDAKKYITGSFPLSLASNSSIASMLLRIAFYHLPDNYLDTYVERVSAVSTTDIKKAFQKQINLEKMLVVSVGQL